MELIDVDIYSKGMKYVGVVSIRIIIYRINRQPHRHKGIEKYAD